MMNILLISGILLIIGIIIYVNLKYYSLKNDRVYKYIKFNLASIISNKANNLLINHLNKNEISHSSDINIRDYILSEKNIDVLISYYNNCNRYGYIYRFNILINYLTVDVDLMIIKTLELHGDNIHEYQKYLLIRDLNSLNIIKALHIINYDFNVCYRILNYILNESSEEKCLDIFKHFYLNANLQVKINRYFYSNHQSVYLDGRLLMNKFPYDSCIIDFLLNENESIKLNDVQKIL